MFADLLDKASSRSLASDALLNFDLVFFSFFSFFFSSLPFYFWLLMFFTDRGLLIGGDYASVRQDIIMRIFALRSLLLS